MGAGRTLQWAELKGAGTAFDPTAAAVGGTAGMTLGSLLGSPLFGAVLSVAGSQLLGRLLGGGQAPYEQALAQQAGIGGQLIPQLQAQAVGRPTLGTQAAERSIRQAVTRLQQSYGATALRRAPTGQTTPTMVQQRRYREEVEIPAIAQMRGQAMTSAQQQLGALYAGAPQAQAQMAMQRRQQLAQFGTDVGTFFAMYKLMGQQGQTDPMVEEAYKAIINILRQARS